MKLQRKHILLLSIAVAAAVNPKVSLAMTCSPSATLTTTAPLQGSNIHIGPDAGNGTVIYSMYFKPSQAITVNCDAPSTAYRPTISWIFSSTPRPLSSWSGNPYGGKVYETNVPGVGVAVRRGSNAIPFTENPWGTTTGALTWLAQTGFDFDLTLLKIGPISPGTINGTFLPTVQIYFQTPFTPQIRVVTVGFTGTLNITSSTCTTPDVNVNLGTYDADKVFKAVGTVTPWVDASVKLTNCPRFYGTINDGQNNYTGPGGSPAGVGARTGNRLLVTMNPNTSVVDSFEGIMSVSPGSSSATGLGIQLSTGNVGDPSTASTYIRFGGQLGVSHTLQNSTSTGYTIPLRARYKQTAPTVTAGKANASVTFTINYY